MSFIDSYLFLLRVSLTAGSFVLTAFPRRVHGLQLGIVVQGLSSSPFLPWLHTAIIQARDGIEEDMIECTKRPARIGVIIKKYPEVFLAKLRNGETMCFQWKELLMPTGAVKLRG